MTHNPFTGVDPRILGQRLQMVRKSLALTQQEVADQLELARTTLGAIESGIRFPKEEELFQLSQIYNKPINDLLRQQIPSEPLIVQFRAARRFEAKLDKEVTQKINEFQDLCSDYVYLEQLLDNKLLPSKAPIYALDESDPEKLTEDFDQGNVLFTNIVLNKITPERLAEEAAIAERNRLGLGDAPILNLRELLEAEGLRIFQMKLPRQICGFFGYTEQLGPCVAIDSNQPAERRQWSLAHEYAHFLTERHQVDISVYNNYQHVPEHERFADAFASTFLMPASSVRRHFDEIKRAKKSILPGDVCMLAHYFFVSFEAMIYRLERLQLIKAGMYERLKSKGFKSKDALSLLNLEPHKLSQDVFPLRYKYLATEALYKEEISEDEYAHFMHTNIVQARSTFQKLRKQFVTPYMEEDEMTKVQLDKNIGA